MQFCMRVDTTSNTGTKPLLASSFFLLLTRSDSTIQAETVALFSVDGEVKQSKSSLPYQLLPYVSFSTTRNMFLVFINLIANCRCSKRTCWYTPRLTKLFCAYILHSIIYSSATGAPLATVQPALGTPIGPGPATGTPIMGMFPTCLFCCRCSADSIRKHPSTRQPVSIHTKPQIVWRI